MLKKTPIFFWYYENNIILYLSIFLELSEENVNKSCEVGMSQYVGQVVCGRQSSLKSNTDVNPQVTKQTKLSFMYSSKVYTCLRCSMPICGESTYNKHVESCSKFKCTKCKKTFLSESSFKKHRRNCPPKRYPCTICKKDYSRQSDADKHIKIHTLVRETFTCHWCGCQCLTGKQLELHIEQVHRDLL